jgi:hypothetical protein
MRVLAWAIVAAVGLVAVYLALGGASYEPAAVADPCASRDWSEPADLEEVGEQIILSALDGAACKLGVSREEIVLAFESRATLGRFAREQDISQDQVAELVRAGLRRAVDEAEQAGALTPRFADTLREGFSYIAVGDVIAMLDQVVG